MQLLDLPPELVRPIFQHVAPSFGLAELLRLRTVCCEYSPLLPLTGCPGRAPSCLTGGRHRDSRR